MARFRCILCLIVLTACNRAEAPPAGDTTAAAVNHASLSLGDLAGRWQLRATDENGGNVVETVLTATADTTAWRWLRPDGNNVPVRIVAVEGDSVTMEAGPFQSALRAGVPVRATMVFRLEDDRLVGHVDARYMLSSGDSVARRPATGTRMP